MITNNYITGIQHALIDHGAVKYASEYDASLDVEILAEALDENIPVDQGALASEGADVHSTATIATALIEMSEKTASDKADVVHEFLQKLAFEQVAGGAPGRVAPGESSARNTDHKKRLVNQITDDEHRATGFKSTPGKSSVGGGTVGKESGHSVSRNKVKEKIRALANQMNDNAHRPNYHGKAGHQAQEDTGHLGSEKAASLTEYLSSL